MIKLQMAFSGFQSSSKLKSGLVEEETVFVRHLNFHLLLLVFHLYVAELMPCNEERKYCSTKWLVATRKFQLAWSFSAVECFCFPLLRVR